MVSGCSRIHMACRPAVCSQPGRCGIARAQVTMARTCSETSAARHSTNHGVMRLRLGQRSPDSFGSAVMQEEGMQYRQRARATRSAAAAKLASVTRGATAKLDVRQQPRVGTGSGAGCADLGQALSPPNPLG
jgi:hypothetical protein